MEKLFIIFKSNFDKNDIKNILTKKLKNTNFTYSEVDTSNYNKELALKNGNMFVIERHDKNENCLYFKKTKDDNKYILVDIIPHNCNYDIEKEEYMNIEKQFSKIENKKSDVRIKFEDWPTDLQKIISASKPREALQDLITSAPNSYNRYDIKKMDKISCFISSYSRKDIDFMDLKHYLYNQTQLNRQYVDFLVDRIKVGLEIILAYKSRNY